MNWNTAFQNYVATLIPIRAQGEGLLLGAPSRHFADIVNRHLAATIVRALGCPVTVVRHSAAIRASAKRQGGGRAG